MGGVYGLEESTIEKIVLGLEKKVRGKKKKVFQEDTSGIS